MVLRYNQELYYGINCITNYIQISQFSYSREFIRQNVDKSKPLFLSILEIYFDYINKFNERESFLQKLNDALQSPQDLTQGYYQLNYKNKKIARKQFVCLLILKFFQLYGKQEINSFFQLWNTCFPQEIQVKKKLSRYDQKKLIKKSNVKSPKFVNQKSPTNFQNSLPSATCTHQIDVLSLESLPPLQYEELTKIHFQDNLHNINTKKRPINNQIFEDESYEEDLFTNCYDQTFNQQVDQKQEEISNQNWYWISNHSNLRGEKPDEQTCSEPCYNLSLNLRNSQIDLERNLNKEEFIDQQQNIFINELNLGCEYR